MKRDLFCISLFVIAFGNVFADTSEFFPLNIPIGMPSEELEGKYPIEDSLYPKRNDDNILTNGIVIYSIVTNIFWDSLWVQIENAKVKSLQYFKINRELLFAHDPDWEDFTDVAKTVSPLFVQLQGQLGTTFEKKVTYGAMSKIRNAMYVWKRKSDVVIFTHSPVSGYEKGNRFDSLLVIAPRLEDAHGPYQRMATNSLPEDELLWADAMGEEGEDGNAGTTLQTAETESERTPKVYDGVDTPKDESQVDIGTPGHGKPSYVTIVALCILFILGMGIVIFVVCRKKA